MNFTKKSLSRGIPQDMSDSLPNHLSPSRTLPVAGALAAELYRLGAVAEDLFLVRVEHHLVGLRD